MFSGFVDAAREARSSGKSSSGYISLSVAQIEDFSQVIQMPEIDFPTGLSCEYSTVLWPRIHSRIPDPFRPVSTGT